ncbi:unnamed protein product [Moneuplotes crassus]|uniref:Uncharacterized protein n=1 Tax=Euplotes crassus TaxID=5936 RepID=A0AAD1U3S4_EUPCR|nr:unnamed protein product [Moneuplotes crassus]
MQNSDYSDQEDFCNLDKRYFMGIYPANQLSESLFGAVDFLDPSKNLEYSGLEEADQPEEVLNFCKNPGSIIEEENKEIFGIQSCESLPLNQFDSFLQSNMDPVESIDKKPSPSTEELPKNLEKFEVPACRNWIRWGKNEDKLLFHKIHELEKQGVLSLDEIINLPSREIKNDPSVRHLCSVFHWLALPRDLVKRIKKRVSDYFSHREIKLMKRIIKNQYKYQNLDYEKILYEFPGKTLARVTEFADLVVTSKQGMKLDLINSNNQA